MQIRPREDLERILQQPKTIAVVGISTNPEKDAHTVPRYMQEQGYTIIPVNPAGGEILGVEAVSSLGDIDGKVDIVDVFRPPDEAAGIAREAAEVGADVIWFQPGTHSKEAMQVAEEAGVEVVTGACIRATHKLLGL